MRKFLATIPLLFFLLLSCGKKGTETPVPATIEITDSWARPASSGMMSAAYFNIKNGTADADTLLSIESDVTDDTQIHESYHAEGGLMGMRAVGLVPVPAGATVEFKQGGLHVMIIQPRKDLVAGDSLALTLYFALSGTHEINVPVGHPKQ